MSHSLFDLFTQLNISEQKIIREHVQHTLDPVTYIKEKFNLLPRVEQEAFARLIEEHKVVPSVPVQVVPPRGERISLRLPSEESSDEEDSWKETSSDEEDNTSDDEEIAFRYDTRLDDALLDYSVNDHCSRCTCHENDDCACDRGCDHYYGTAEDLDRELDEIQEDYNRWYFATHYAKAIKGATRVVSSKRAVSPIRRVAACPKVSINAVPKAEARSGRCSFPNLRLAIPKAGAKASAKAGARVGTPPLDLRLAVPRVSVLPSYQ